MVAKLEAKISNLNNMENQQNQNQVGIMNQKGLLPILKLVVYGVLTVFLLGVIYVTYDLNSKLSVGNIAVLAFWAVITVSLFSSVKIWKETLSAIIYGYFSFYSLVYILGLIGLVAKGEGEALGFGLYFGWPLLVFWLIETIIIKKYIKKINKKVFIWIFIMTFVLLLISYFAPFLNL